MQKGKDTPLAELKPSVLTREWVPLEQHAVLLNIWSVQFPDVIQVKPGGFPPAPCEPGTAGVFARPQDS